MSINKTLWITMVMLTVHLAVTIAVVIVLCHVFTYSLFFACLLNFAIAARNFAALCQQYRIYKLVKAGDPTPYVTERRMRDKNYDLAWIVWETRIGKNAPLEGKERSVVYQRSMLEALNKNTRLDAFGEMKDLPQSEHGPFPAHPLRVIRSLGKNVIFMFRRAEKEKEEI